MQCYFMTTVSLSVKKKCLILPMSLKTKPADSREEEVVLNKYFHVE